MLFSKYYIQKNFIKKACSEKMGVVTVNGKQFVNHDEVQALQKEKKFDLQKDK